MDSGIGLLAAAAAVRRLRPDADLVLSLDPDGMPWGPRTPEDLTERALAVAEAAAAHRPDALIVGCNTATVHALTALRARLEPGIPVIGTVPAIKPAAAGGGPFAIWATPATTGSPYQRGLIEDFADGVPVTEVPCPGLADAVEHADEAAIDAAVAAAAALTPDDVTTVVLGCTHYELVAERIRAAVQRPGRPPLVLHGSAGAVAAQALRRIGEQPAPRPRPHGTLTVLLSGREGTPARARPGLRGRPAAAGRSARPLTAARHRRHPSAGPARRPPGAVTLRHGYPRERNLSNLIGMRDHPHGEHAPHPHRTSGPAAPPTGSSGCWRSCGAACMALGIELAVDSAWTSGIAPLVMSVVGCIAAGLLVLFGTLAFVHVALQVDKECLEVRCGHIGVPRRRIPLVQRRRRRRSSRTSPRATGAAGATAGGPRRAPRSSYDVVRAWCCELWDGHTFTVTVDDAEAAVRVIQARLRPSSRASRA